MAEQHDQPGPRERAERDRLAQLQTLRGLLCNVMGMPDITAKMIEHIRDWIGRVEETITQSEREMIPTARATDELVKRVLAN